MRTLSQLLDPGRRAHLLLGSWILNWLPTDQAEMVAADAMCTMLSRAMRGRRSVEGPYRALFTTAEFHMRWLARVHGYDIPFGIWRQIPVPPEELLCELARLYAIVYQLVQLMQMSNADQDMLVEALWRARYNSGGQWYTTGEDPEFDLQVVELLEFMKLTSAQHDCSGHDICLETSTLWQHEDRRSTRWLAEFRPHARESSSGHKQDHDPDDDRPTVAVHLLGNNWSGGLGKRRSHQW